MRPSITIITLLAALSSIGGAVHGLPALSKHDDAAVSGYDFWSLPWWTSTPYKSTLDQKSSGSWGSSAFSISVKSKDKKADK
ncbi:hypothetical protein BDF19DRAFT_450640 [Syncephalis fuscata]|nr:hypothetical protein BDF19DRAFT_450640 [Syncephalis fuscata]